MVVWYSLRFYAISWPYFSFTAYPDTLILPAIKHAFDV